MKQAFFTVLLVLALCGGASGKDVTFLPGSVLTLDQCIAIGLKLHPSVARDRYGVQQRDAVLGQAKSAYYPRVDASAGFTRNFTEKERLDRHFLLDTYNENLGTGALEQMIFDFGKTPADVKARRFDLESSRFDLDDTMNNVARNVRVTYFGVLLARRAREVSLEVVGQYRQHLAQAQTFFQAGKKPKYDVTKADVDLSNAELDLITAENNLKISWLRLSNAMGLDREISYDIEDNLAFVEYRITLEDALRQAYQDRPDLKSLLAQKESAAASTERARKDYFPTIKGKAAYNFIGSDYPLSQGWYAGVEMSVNLFQGFFTEKKIEESWAKGKSVEARIGDKKLDVTLEVQEAFLNLLKARDRIANTELQIRQTTENLELANLRYKAGLADPIEVTDATVSFSQAKLANIRALYDYRTEQANIERAMGKR